VLDVIVEETGFLKKSLHLLSLKREKLCSQAIFKADKEKPPHITGFLL
jgi:hypothetical protein